MMEIIITCILLYDIQPSCIDDTNYVNIFVSLIPQLYYSVIKSVRKKKMSSLTSVT